MAALVQYCQHQQPCWQLHRMQMPLLQAEQRSGLPDCIRRWHCRWPGGCSHTPDVGTPVLFVPKTPTLHNSY